MCQEDLLRSAVARYHPGRRRRVVEEVEAQRVARIVLAVAADKRLLRTRIELQATDNRAVVVAPAALGEQRQATGVVLPLDAEVADAADPLQEAVTAIELQVFVQVEGN